MNSSIEQRMMMVESIYACVRAYNVCSGVCVCAHTGRSTIFGYLWLKKSCLFICVSRVFAFKYVVPVYTACTTTHTLYTLIHSFIHPFKVSVAVFATRLRSRCMAVPVLCPPVTDMDIDQIDNIWLLWVRNTRRDRTRIRYSLTTPNTHTHTSA